jgi:uncharacterized protein YaiL (DUF2058 family)
MMAKTLIVIEKAVREAGKKLPFTSRKSQNEILQYAADDLADAYRIGAEEAQREIVERLRELAEKEKATANG